MHHLAFRTHKLFELRAFYVQLFAFEAIRQTATSVWLSVGQTILMLEQATVDEPEIPFESQEFVAFQCAAEDLPAWQAHLQAHHIAVEHQTAHTLYFRDPDGRRVGVSAYPVPAESC